MSSNPQLSQNAAAPYVRREMSPLNAVTLKPDEAIDGMAQAYAAQLGALDGLAHEVAGWKLGGTTALTRHLFGVDKLYFGALMAPEVLHQPATAPGFALCELKGEIEVAVRIAGGAASGSAESVFDAWCVAFEMPASPVANVVECGASTLVADRCGAGCLVLGPERALSTLPRDADVALQENGQQVAEGALSALLDAPLACAAEFLKSARTFGFRPAPGQWIATGGLSLCVDVQKGADLHILFGGEVEFGFAIDCGEAG